MNTLFTYHYLTKILAGTATTVELMVAALVLGLLLAIIIALATQTKSWFLNTPLNAYIFLIRGTPMLLQFFIIYYGSAQFIWIKASPLWLVLKSPFWCAVIALAINTSAYTAVLINGAIKSVPKGELAACQALGMGKMQAMWHIILPHAMRIALPAYSNEVIMILKGTSLASTITVLELTGVAHQIAARTYMFAEVFLVVGLIYLFINVIIVKVFSKLEKQFAYNPA